MVSQQLGSHGLHAACPPTLRQLTRTFASLWHRVAYNYVDSYMIKVIYRPSSNNHYFVHCILYRVGLGKMWFIHDLSLIGRFCNDYTFYLNCCQFRPGQFRSL